MFYCIYNDGQNISKHDLENAFSLPGKYHVFYCGHQAILNHPEGICYYKSQNETENFKINYLELVDVKKISGATLYYQFCIFDHRTEVIKNIPVFTKYPALALIEVVMYILRASEFPSIEIYDQVKELAKYKKENADLKLKIEELTKENTQLRKE